MGQLPPQVLRLRPDHWAPMDQLDLSILEYLVDRSHLRGRMDPSHPLHRQRRLGQLVRRDPLDLKVQLTLGLLEDLAVQKDRLRQVFRLDH
jgi:hypothetical protein